jgi:ketosteroid isomerase-like protein
MDDLYDLNVAKTQFREAYVAGDVELLLSVFSPGGFTDLSDGLPSASGEFARERLRTRTANLFREYSVRLNIINIKFLVLGNVAYDFGWHEFMLYPKAGGAAVRRRERYFEMWNKDADGGWRITFFMNNADVAERMGDDLPTWFKGVPNATLEARN